LGRWITRDPLGEWGGLNLYNAARNNHIDNYDINGLFLDRLIGKAVVWGGKKLFKSTIKRQIKKEIRAALANELIDQAFDCIEEQLDDIVEEVIERMFQRSAIEEGASWIPVVGIVIDILDIVSIIKDVKDLDVKDIKKALKEKKKKLEKEKLAAPRKSLPAPGDIDGIPLGSLDDLAARKWYHSQLDDIPKMIDESLPLKQQARQAVDLRNEIREQARSLMKNRQGAIK
jgi:hypothetical protein